MSANLDFYKWFDSIAGKLKEDSINEVRTATNDFERVFEETVEEKIK